MTQAEPVSPSQKAPPHVAIILDGNGRWATSRGLVRVAGHEVGADRVRDVVRAAGRLGVKYLTVFALSLDNKKRPEAEVRMLYALLERFAETERDELASQGVRVEVIGDLPSLPQSCQDAIRGLVDATRHGQQMVFRLAVAYGAREDVTQATRKLASAVARGELDPSTIDENTLRGFMWTAGAPNPDLVIRTGGEHRLSDFLLLEAAYAELYFTDIAWPDFGAAELGEAIDDFAGRDRRFGLVKTTPTGKPLASASATPLPVAVSPLVTTTASLATASSRASGSSTRSLTRRGVVRDVDLPPEEAARLDSLPGGTTLHGDVDVGLGRRRAHALCVARAADATENVACLHDPARVRSLRLVEEVRVDDRDLGARRAGPACAQLFLAEAEPSEEAVPARIAGVVDNAVRGGEDEGAGGRRDVDPAVDAPTHGPEAAPLGAELEVVLAGPAVRRAQAERAVHRVAERPAASRRRLDTRRDRGRRDLHGLGALPGALPRQGARQRSRRGQDAHGLRDGVPVRASPGQEQRDQRPRDERPSPEGSEHGAARRFLRHGRGGSSRPRGGPTFRRNEAETGAKIV